MDKRCLIDVQSMFLWLLYQVIYAEKVRLQVLYIALIISCI